MGVEKVLVQNFKIIEYNGQMGIELEVDDEPIQFASFLYDGRNCAILIRNKVKAYIFTNLAYELRLKLLNSEPLLIIETKENNTNNVYAVDITKIDEVPYPDKFDNVLNDILYQIKDKYGDKAIDMMVSKFWPEDK